MVDRPATAAASAASIAEAASEDAIAAASGAVMAASDASMRREKLHNAFNRIKVHMMRAKAIAMWRMKQYRA